MKMNEISLCMIVRNEAVNIEKCLDSVKKIANEVVIVDTGSADNTKEIVKAACRKFKINCKIVDFKWVDDFSAARNEGLRHATKEWIFTIDADEILDSRSSSSILELVKDESADGYLFPTKHYTNDKSIAGYLPAEDEMSRGYSGFYLSMVCKLFRNKKGYSFSGFVHELVEPSIEQKKGKFAVGGVLMHHYGNAEPDSARKKRQYYLSLAERKTAENPSSQSYFELGVLQKENGNLKGAEESFFKAVEIDKNNNAALYEIGIIKEASNDIDNAIGYYKKSLAVKEDPETFFSLGTCLLKKGALKEAYQHLVKSMMLNPNKYQTYNNLGALQEKSGDFEQALQMLEIAVKLNPHNVTGYYNMGVVYEKKGDAEKALECFQKSLILGHKNSEVLQNKIASLRESITKSTSYTYSFGNKEK